MCRVKLTQPFSQQFKIFFRVGRGELLTGHHLGAAAVHLQRANRRHDHRAVWNQQALAALDIAKLLEAHVGAEAGFGNDVPVFPDQSQGNHVGQNRRVAVGDVGKGAGMDKRRSSLQRLHQVGHDRVLHDHRKRAAHAQVVGGDRLALAVRPNHHAPQTLAHVAQAGGQRQNRHDLAGH